MRTFSAPSHQRPLCLCVWCFFAEKKTIIGVYHSTAYHKHVDVTTTTPPVRCTSEWPIKQTIWMNIICENIYQLLLLDQLGQGHWTLVFHLSTECGCSSVAQLLVARVDPDWSVNSDNSHLTLDQTDSWLRWANNAEYLRSKNRSINHTSRLPLVESARRPITKSE